MLEPCRKYQEEMAIHQREKNRTGLVVCERNKRKTAGHCRSLPVTLVLLVAFVIATVSAADPTVIVTDYTVTPAVLMPGDTGTITLTIKNTAQAASEKENTGIVSGGTFASTKNTDINVFIENVHLDENGIEVLNEDFDRIGELGPGQSVPGHVCHQSPGRERHLLPRSLDRCQGRQEHPLPDPGQCQHRYRDPEETLACHFKNAARPGGHRAMTLPPDSRSRTPA